MFDKLYCKSVDTKAHQETLSVAALHTVVSALGGSCQSSDHSADGMGVDATCLFRGCFSPNPNALRRIRIEFQLKSTRRPQAVTKKDKCWAHSVDTAQLRKYLEPSNDPLILALLILPENVALENCVEIKTEQTLLKKCLYWTSLKEFPLDSNQKSQTVYFPQKNILTPETLAFEVLASLSERKGLCYAGQE